MSARDTERVEFYRGLDQEWRYRVVAANNEIVAEGEGYANKSDAMDTVEKFVKPDLPWWEQFEEGGDWVPVDKVVEG